MSSPSKAPPDSPSNADLQEIEGRAARASAGGWRRVETGGLELFVQRDGRGNDTVHLFARRDTGEALIRAGADLSRLAAALRKERAEAENLRARMASAQAEAKARPRPGAPAAQEIDEDVSMPLAAPFRVGAQAVRAAKTDQLMALAVQVARALQPEAKDVERARLIAMAFAASQGDTDGFWAARRQRPAGRTAKRGKL